MLVPRAVCLRDACTACSLYGYLYMSYPRGLHLRHLHGRSVLGVPRGDNDLRLPLILRLRRRLLGLLGLHLRRHLRILLAHRSRHAGLWW